MMRIAELEKYLATRAYPTSVGVCRSPGRWCETCDDVHPADLRVSPIHLAGDEGIVSSDCFCCFPAGISIALPRIAARGLICVVVSVLNGHMPVLVEPEFLAVCCKCGFCGPAAEDCHQCIAGEMFPLWRAA